LDVTRARIKLTKITYQNRVRGSIILIRLDADGAPHRNPDGAEIPCPHIHIYREGFGDKWAYPIPVEKYPNLKDFRATFESFMRHCNVTEPPNVLMGLF
jgi:hypothetical protein